MSNHYTLTYTRPMNKELVLVGSPMNEYQQAMSGNVVELFGTNKYSSLGDLYGGSDDDCVDLYNKFDDDNELSLSDTPLPSDGDLGDDFSDLGDDFSDLFNSSPNTSLNNNTSPLSVAQQYYTTTKSVPTVPTTPPSKLYNNFEYADFTVITTPQDSKLNIDDDLSPGDYHSLQKLIDELCPKPKPPVLNFHSNIFNNDEVGGNGWDTDEVGWSDNISDGWDSDESDQITIPSYIKISHIIQYIFDDNIKENGIEDIVHRIVKEIEDGCDYDQCNNLRGWLLKHEIKDIVVEWGVNRPTVVGKLTPPTVYELFNHSVIENWTKLKLLCVGYILDVLHKDIGALIHPECTILSEQKSKLYILGLSSMVVDIIDGLKLLEHTYTSTSNFELLRDVLHRQIITKSRLLQCIEITIENALANTNKYCVDELFNNLDEFYKIRQSFKFKNLDKDLRKYLIREYGNRVAVQRKERAQLTNNKKIHAVYLESTPLV